MVEQSIFSRVIANNPAVIHHIFDALPEPTFLINGDGYYIEAWGTTRRSFTTFLMRFLNQPF
ncbi:hypothetical protein VVS222_01014 [Vibrio vulnificus]|nr:hypothetical protein VVS222_01014 [Vibrio vulnificus]